MSHLLRFTRMTGLALLLTASSLGARAAEPQAAEFKVHRMATGAPGIFANAYVVETRKSLVLIDATLLTSTAQELRSKIDALGKPLVAAALTHGHPDHYNGLEVATAGASLPIYATPGAIKVIQDHDAAKEKQWRPVFGDQWPAKRRFPNQALSEGGSFTVDGVRFVVHDLGAGESDSDAYWVVGSAGQQVAFIGDVVLDGVHAYVTDGHTTQWLANIKRLKAGLGAVQRLYPGHGAEGGPELLDAQAEYLTAYRAAIAELSSGRPVLSDEEATQLEARMKAKYPQRELQFLVKLGATPVAAELARAH